MMDSAEADVRRRVAALVFNDVEPQNPYVKVDASSEVGGKDLDL